MHATRDAGVDVRVLASPHLITAIKMNDIEINFLSGFIIACILGVQAAIDADVGHVVVETDAAEVVKAVYSEAYDFSAMTPSSTSSIACYLIISSLSLLNIVHDLVIGLAMSWRF